MKRLFSVGALASSLFVYGCDGIERVVDRGHDAGIVESIGTSEGVVELENPWRMMYEEPWEKLGVSPEKYLRVSLSRRLGEARGELIIAEKRLDYLKSLVGKSYSGSRFSGMIYRQTSSGGWRYEPAGLDAARTRYREAGERVKALNIECERVRGILGIDWIENSEEEERE